MLSKLIDDMIRFLSYEFKVENDMYLPITRIASTNNSTWATIIFELDQ